MRSKLTKSHLPFGISIVLLFALFMPALAQEAERPNIVLIMSDDMGYSDIGCFGGEIETPTLNALAERGLRFTQFYNTGRCCPTRAALLTGLYPHQAGMGWMTTDRGHDGYRGDLNKNCVTIAEALRTAGYATYMTGKWHVTKHTQPEGPKHNWPLQRGFDRFYGTITGGGSFYDPGTLTRDNSMISPFADAEYQPRQYYYTDAISDHAVRFISEHKNSQQPFFLYVAYTAAHWPMHALPEDIAKYKGKYDAGYAAIRARRFARLKELGLIEAGWEMSRQQGDWKNVKHRDWEIRCMEVYAAMIDRMDQGIGKIVAALKETKQFDNSLILFLQDNGGCQEGVGRSGNSQRPAKPSLPKIADEAIRLDVIPKQDRAGVHTLSGPDIMPGPADTYIAYGIDWANVSNTPFREYKHFVHEGGISTPLIAHWPQGIARVGKLEHQPGHLVDIMATCLAVAGAEYPKSAGDQKIHPLEGVSLVPAFSGNSLDRQQPIFWEHEGNRAIRDGNWKLVAKENQPWELYDLSTDRTEMHDLAKEQPERVKELSARWQAYAARAYVLPLGTWKGAKTVAKFNKKQKRFELKPQDQLSREKAPFVENKPLSLAVKLAGPPAEGVLIAQGGSSAGYVLSIDEGILHFAVRIDGKLSVVSAANQLSEKVRSLSVQWKSDASVTLFAGDEEIAAGKTSGLLNTMPIDGLEVGQDSGGLVGSYEQSNAYAGEIESVVLEVGK